MQRDMSCLLEKDVRKGNFQKRLLEDKMCKRCLDDEEDEFLVDVAHIGGF